MKFRTKLILLGALTMAVALVVLAVVQMQTGQRLIVETAEKRVARNIDMAWQMLEMRQRELVLMVDMYTAQPKQLNPWRKRQGVDVLTMVDTTNLKKGTVAAAVFEQYLPRTDTVRTGIIALDPKHLANEAPELIERCRIDGEIAPALALFSIRKNNHGGAVVAAQILTRAQPLLGRVQRGLFGDERYKGRRTGTVTVFTGTMRTSTTVEKENRISAVGTFVSDEVAKVVLTNKKTWTGPAYVVDAWYMSRYDPILDADGKVVGMLYIGELEARLLAHKHQIAFVGVASVMVVLLLALLAFGLILRFERRAKEQRNKVRFEFLRVLGHELKAPINAVDGYLRLVEQETLGPVPPKYQPLIERSVLRIEYMRKLIADMLDLTRIEAGEKRREIVDDSDVAAVLREGIETVHPEADGRGITLHVDAPQTLLVRADRGELSIICNNLLTNAVKYNRDKGEVHASLSMKEGALRLVVKDTGIGMSEAEQAKLFGEFVRIRNAKTRDVLGSGLGLHILQKIVGLYRGEIQVESIEDKGTTFTVVLYF